MFLADKALTKCDFFDTGDLESLTRFDRLKDPIDGLALGAVEDRRGADADMWKVTRRSRWDGEGERGIGSYAFCHGAGRSPGVGRRLDAAYLRAFESKIS